MPQSAKSISSPEETAGLEPRAPNREGIQALFAEAAKLHGAGRLAKAEALYKQLIEREPGHGAALRNLGLIALQQGDPARAMVLLERAVAAAPQDPQIWRSLGKLQLSRGAQEAAIASFRRALALRPAEAQQRRDLVEALIATGRPAEATPEIKAYLERHPVVPDPRNAKQPVSVLALYGLENPAFEIDGGGGGAGFAFTINSGHFKIEDVIDHGHQKLYRLFLGAGSDPEAIRARPDADVIINCIADAELEAGSLARAEALLADCKVPVINAPGRVLPTRREEVCDLLGDLPGIVFPKTLRCHIDEKDSLACAVGTAGLALPLIVRPVESQTGIDMRKIEDADGLAEAAADFAGRTVFVIAFHDFSDPADGLWRKMRLFCIDGVLHPEHRLILDHWNLHSADRLKLMRGDKRLRLEEISYLEDWRATVGETAAAALERLHERLKLDYFGIDFAVLPSGEALIFEANASMRINLDYVGDFPYMTGYIARITDAFKAMLARRLAEREVSP